MAKRNSVGSHDMPRNTAFRPAYGTAQDSDDENSCMASIITFASYLLVFITLPISIWGCVKVVQEDERAVTFRLGRLRSGGAKGPGLFFILPCIDTYRCVDLRTGAFDVPPQEILTRDSVTINVDAVVYYQVSNPLSAICNNDDYNRSTRLLAATTLRNVLGTRNLSEILSDREAIADSMHQTLEEATNPWGEQKSSKALKEAADIIAMSPAALQLRYLPTLNSISAEKNSTIIFPLPMEMFNTFDGVRKRQVNTSED